MSSKRYTDNDVIEAVKVSKSIAQVLRILGLKEAGGNHFNMKRKIQILSLDTSHFTGMAWNKGKQLKSLSNYSRGEKVKPHLIKQRGHKCENCGLETWLDRPIPLELHHIDGDKTNGNEENLQLLCCNCHSFTDNWRKQKN